VKLKDLDSILLRCGRSSSPGEFHPEALTEPYVTLSRHTALHSFGLSLSRTTRLRRKGLILNIQLAEPSFELCHPLRSPSIADASTLLQDDPPSSSASIFPFRGSHL
jgi:hypothetical protein